jgi:hypothetical protein
VSLQDPKNDVRRMGDALSNVFESKYLEFVRQQQEEQVRCLARPCPSPLLAADVCGRVLLQLAEANGDYHRDNAPRFLVKWKSALLLASFLDIACVVVLLVLLAACWCCRRRCRELILCVSGTAGTADLSYKEATWELAQEVEDEVIADLYRCACVILACVRACLCACVCVHVCVRGRVCALSRTAADSAVAVGALCSRNRPPTGPRTEVRHYPRSYQPTQVYKGSPQFPNGRTLREYQVEGLNWLVGCRARPAAVASCLWRVSRDVLYCDVAVRP